MKTENAVKTVVVSMLRGINDLTGKVEHCKIKVPTDMCDRMIIRSDLEKVTGEKIAIEVGSSRTNLIYIDTKRDLILGHESAKKYVNTDMNREQIIFAELRYTAITTIGGQLARQGYEFPKERVIANMKKWQFKIDDLQLWGERVGKWTRIAARLKLYGMI